MNTFVKAKPTCRGCVHRNLSNDCTLMTDTSNCNFYKTLEEVIEDYKYCSDRFNMSLDNYFKYLKDRQFKSIIIDKIKEYIKENEI